MNILDEIWRDIDGYEELYQVSNLGNVRSCDRWVECLSGRGRSYRQFYSGKTKKLSLDTYGYQVVGLSKPNKQLLTTVHKLVAQAFLGDRPNGFQVNHIDGNKSNNSVGNLEYCSQKDNIRHAHAIGLIDRNKGEKCSYSKLKASDILIIKDRLANGHSQSSIAKDYGVVQQCISAIKIGRTWSP